MSSWGEVRRDAPDLAAAGESLLYQHGVGLGYLATVAMDGTPRVHPMCPLLHDRGMFAFIIASPKQADLHRGGAYAMHSFPRPDDEDAFFFKGRARLVTDTDLRRELSEQFVAERARFAVPVPVADDHLFEFDIERALLTTTTGHGDTKPSKRTWRAPVSHAQRSSRLST